MKNVLKLFWVSLILFLAACAPKKIGMPSFEGMDIREYLAEKEKIEEMETTFSIVFQKNETEISGEGALNISRGGDMSLRVYSLGFLAMELTSQDGITRSSPHIDRNKTLILTRGLRDCLFWWDIKVAALEEDNTHYVLKDQARTLWIDKKTFLPEMQRISFEDGKELIVYYDEPAADNKMWYQSRMRIELLRYAVTMTVKDIAFRP